MAGVLEILYKLLCDHEVSDEDFCDEVVELPNGATAVTGKAPGFTLLIQMLNDSPLFKMVLSVLFHLSFVNKHLNNLLTNSKHLFICLTLPLF